MIYIQNFRSLASRLFLFWSEGYTESKRGRNREGSFKEVGDARLWHKSPWPKKVFLRDLFSMRSPKDDKEYVIPFLSLRSPTGLGVDKKGGKRETNRHISSKKLMTWFLREGSRIIIIIILCNYRKIFADSSSTHHFPQVCNLVWVHATKRFTFLTLVTKDTLESAATPLS